MEENLCGRKKLTAGKEDAVKNLKLKYIYNLLSHQTDGFVSASVLRRIDVCRVMCRLTFSVLLFAYS